VSALKDSRTSLTKIIGPEPLGLSYKSIIRNQKREKSVGFLCGQRYSWTKVLRIGLLAGFSSDLLALQKTTADIG
jgi:hypothetical protein